MRYYGSTTEVLLVERRSAVSCGNISTKYQPLVQFQTRIVSCSPTNTRTTKEGRSTDSCGYSIPFVTGFRPAASGGGVGNAAVWLKNLAVGARARPVRHGDAKSCSPRTFSNTPHITRRLEPMSTYRAYGEVQSPIVYPHNILHSFV